MSRGPRSRRTRTLTWGELTRAAVLGLLCLAAFVVTAQVSLAGALRDRFPQLALRFEPADAEAQGSLAALIASSDPRPLALKAAQSLAQRAIRRNVLSPVAVRTLGEIRADGGELGKRDSDAAKLFAEAERLSRRDLMTQIWLAEFDLNRGDVPGVLRHFDIALRTSDSGEDSLFPLLVAASSNKGLADALAARMRARPDWAQPFANYLLGGQVPPTISAYIYQNALDARNPADLKLIETLTQRLADAGETDLVLALADHFRLATGGPTLVANGGFESRGGVQPFDWSLTGEADLWAAVEPGPRGGKVLALNASNGQSGNLARQLVRLPPGTYRLSAEVGNIPGDTYLRPTLTVRCAGQNQVELARVKPTSDGARTQRVGTTLIVPQDCCLQWILVSMSGADQPPDDLPWVDNVALVRSGA